MNGERHEDVGGLEERLGELTRWRGGTACRGGKPWHAWERAWMAAGAERTERGIRAILSQPIPHFWLGGIAAVLIVAVMVGLLLPSLGKARSASYGRMALGIDRPAPSSPAGLHLAGGVADAPTEEVKAGESWAGLASRPPGGSEQADGRPAIEAAARAGLSEHGPTTDRAVIRRATIELSTPDVRSAFLKAQHALSEAEGEYVQDSSLTGSGKTAQANLTLRVAASRLGAVLSALRELGEVKSEQQAGEDVTTQMVDLEARLRNERRVEKELLDLLDSRKNSPLKEILDLRGSLSGVRQSIEQLAGQQEKLGRLVSLASVLVIIRTGDAAVVDEVKKEGMWGYFATAAGSAWVRGLTALADTLAVIVSIAVGGLVWWVMIAIGAAVVVRVRRRAVAGAAA